MPIHHFPCYLHAPFLVAWLSNKRFTPLFTRTWDKLLQTTIFRIDSPGPEVDKVEVVKG